MTKVDSLYKLFKKRPKAAERVEKTAEAWGQQKHDSRYREIKALQQFIGIAIIQFISITLQPH